MTKSVNSSTIDGSSSFANDAGPAGTWTILRFGYTLLGAKTKCTSPGAQGWEIDFVAVSKTKRHPRRMILQVAYTVKGTEVRERELRGLSPAERVVAQTEVTAELRAQAELGLTARLAEAPPFRRPLALPRTCSTSRARSACSLARSL